jgi:hypothetical protein
VTLLVGLTVYAYIPLAARFDPPLAYNHPTTLEAFIALVTGEQFRSQEAGILSPDSIGTTLTALPDLVGLTLGRGAAILPIAGVAGLVVLLVRRPALALALAAILVVSADVWANYLRLEHYLLVPFLLLGLGAAVALEAAARAGTDKLPSMARRIASPAAIGAGVVIAIVIAAVSLPAADRSGNHSGDDYVATMAQQLPPNAAIFSFWGASTPLWHMQFVTGQRPDVQVVDDTNVVWEPGGTREERMLAMVCHRPVYVVRAFESELDSTRKEFTLKPAFSVVVGVGGPVATTTLTVYRVVATADTCA